MIVADSRGLITTKREGLDDSKKRYMQDIEGNATGRCNWRCRYVPRSSLQRVS